MFGVLMNRDPPAMSTPTAVRGKAKTWFAVGPESRNQTESALQRKVPILRTALSKMTASNGSRLSLRNHSPAWDMVPGSYQTGPHAPSPERRPGYIRNRSDGDR